MTPGRCRRSGIVAGFVLIALGISPAADAQGLTDSETNALNGLLGAGVLGAAMPSNPIANPASLLPLSPATWTFQVTGGPNQGATETHVLQPASAPSPGAQWQYAVGESTIYTLGTLADGSIVSPSEQDLSQGVVTQYAPPRPVLTPGMQPGQSQSSTTQVSVYNSNDLSTVAHSGSLNLTLTYLGQYQVTVPAGTYSAALIKWQFNGEVGPATVDDVEYRFFADGVGPVAAIDKQSVAAFLVYNSNTKFGKVLASQGQ